MNYSLAKYSLASALFLSTAFSSVSAESPVVIDPEIDITASTERYPLVDADNLPFSAESRKNYAISLGGGKGALISPSWVLTASHVITWDKQKNPWNLSMRFDGRGGKQYRAKKVFRHKSKDLALVQLRTPIFEGREPVLLLRDPIPKRKSIRIKKVTEGQRVWKNIPARGSRKENLYVSKKQRKGGPGTSGSPWLVESAEVGDVLVGVTHGSGRAPQVAHVKKWLTDIVTQNTPEEQLHWASRSQALASAKITEEKKSSTLIVLP